MGPLFPPGPDPRFARKETFYKSLCNIEPYKETILVIELLLYLYTTIEPLIPGFGHIVKMVHIAPFLQYSFSQNLPSSRGMIGKIRLRPSYYFFTLVPQLKTMPHVLIYAYM